MENVLHPFAHSFVHVPGSATHSLSCCRFVDSLIQKEVSDGTPVERVVVGGFSQGGAVALHQLRQPHKLAGIFGAPSQHSVLLCMFCWICVDDEGSISMRWAKELCSVVALHQLQQVDELAGGFGAQSLQNLLCICC